MLAADAILPPLLFMPFFFAASDGDFQRCRCLLAYCHYALLDSFHIDADYATPYFGHATPLPPLLILPCH
jgi:hypothetical protein